MLWPDWWVLFGPESPIWGIPNTSEIDMNQASSPWSIFGGEQSRKGWPQCKCGVSRGHKLGLLVNSALCSRKLKQLIFEGEILYDIPYVWNLKWNDTMNFLTKQKQTHRLWKWPYGCLGEEWGEGVVREFGMGIYTLIYFKWITNKDLLYSAQNSINVLCHPVGRWVWGRMDTCVSMPELLYCSPETITALLINYALAWKIPWMGEPGELQSMGSLRVRHDWVTSLSLFTFMHWRRKWQPTPVFLPGESQGWGSLVGCRLRGHTESDTTEVT